MEDSLGIVLFHIISFQRDMLYPATLGEQQVCSWRQGVDIGSRGGSNRLWRTIVVDACRRQTLENQWPCGCREINLSSVLQLLQTLHWSCISGLLIHRGRHSRYPALSTCDLLTHWSAARPRASPGDLLSISVHAPAVSRAAVALHGFVGTVLVARRDVLSNGRSGAPWTGLTLETVPVDLTLCLCPLCGEKRKISSRVDTDSLKQCHKPVQKLIYISFCFLLHKNSHIPRKP